MSHSSRGPLLVGLVALAHAGCWPGVPPARGDQVAAPDVVIAVDGDDSNPGTAAAPFASLVKAREAVRTLVATGRDEDILVLVRGGTYPLAETLTFGPKDSGTETCSITYAAAPGERVVLSGGRKIVGWKPGPDGIWTAEIPAVRAGRWYFRQLFIDGQRAIRARTPNRGWSTAKPVKAVDYDRPEDPVVVGLDVPGGVAAWAHAQDIEVASIRNNDGGRKPLAAVDPAAQTVTLRPPHRWAPKVFGHDWYNGIADGRCYLENAREFLDAPGEWYLDRATGVLHYWPRPGEDLTRCEVVAPVVQHTLLAVAGTRGNPVRNLHFRGLHVEHVDWPLPEHGYMGLFACNVPFLRDTGEPGHRFIDAAVEVTHARACSFRDGGVGRVGGMGLVLREGTADIAIEGNVIQQTGAGGIGLGQCNVGGGYLRGAPAPEPGEYERFRVRNNHVHHCGTDYHGATGVAVYRTRDSVISHNLVHDTAYFGICVAGDQDPAWRFVTNNAVERNHVHRAMQITQDGAALYVCFSHHGGNNLVRGNLVHDTSANHASAGLYLDSDCAGVTFERNVFYRNPSMTMILNDSQDLARNTWIGNLVVATEEESPPAAFVEAMAAYAGLEPAYRKPLQGGAGQTAELSVLDGDAGRIWQIDLPAGGRGVLCRLDDRPATGNPVVVMPRGLDAAATYALETYAGELRPTLASGEGKLHFPMVAKIGPVSEAGLPTSMTGRDLLDKGLSLADDPGVTWIVYRRP